MNEKSKDRKPNWSVWANVPRLKLWEAVALSLNIDPQQVRFNRNGWMAGPGRGPSIDEGQDFDDRMTVAQANVSLTGPLIPNQLYQGVLEDRSAVVKLSEFGALANSIKWQLPDDFPCAPSNETPEQRRTRIKRKHTALTASGHTSPTKALADQEGVSEERIRQLIRGSGKSAPDPSDPFRQIKKGR